MDYHKGKTYSVVYIDNKLQEKHISYTPDKDMNIAGIISDLKSNNTDFVKLKSISEKQDKKESINTDDKVTNLYDLLEIRNFEPIEVVDSANRGNSFTFTIHISQADTDPYETFKVTFAQSLKIDPISVSDARQLEKINIDTTSYILKNLHTFEQYFDLSGTTQQEEVEDMAEKLKLLVIGAGSDMIYNKLLNAKLTESEDDKFDELDLTDEEKEKDDTSEEFNELDLTDEEDTPVSNELEGTGEDQTDTAEAVSDAVEDVEQEGEVDGKQNLAVETANSSLDVLIADENSAIDGYNSFLNQAKNTLIPPLYDVLETEINEIIADEQDHINKLTTIKLNFKFNDDTVQDTEDSLNESKLVEDHQLYYDDIQNMSTEERHKLWMTEHTEDFEDTDEGNNMFWDWAEEQFPVKELNESKKKVNVEDVITLLDADIDSPYAEASSDEIQEFIDENPDMTAREIAIGYKNYEQTGEFNVPEFNLEDAYNMVYAEAENYYKSSEINADTLDRVARKYFSLEFTDEQLDELEKYFEDKDKLLYDQEQGLTENNTISNDYKGLEAKVEEEVYNYLKSNGFDTLNMNLSNDDAEIKFNEILGNFQSDILKDYMENHNVYLYPECILDDSKPYGIRVSITED